MGDPAIHSTLRLIVAVNKNYLEISPTGQFTFGYATCTVGTTATIISGETNRQPPANTTYLCLARPWFGSYPYQISLPCLVLRIFPRRQVRLVGLCFSQLL